MSGRRDHLFAMTAQDQYDPSFALYDSSFQQQYPGTTGPPTHFDGVGFWYRPEPQEAIFEHNKLLYNQNIPVIHSPMEQPMSIKHRRTRSGCFTCRQRRVKCDETRPVCDRCKKGNRECQFPQPSSSSRRIDPQDPRNTQHKASTKESKNESAQILATIDDDSEDDGEGEESVSPISDSPQPERIATNPQKPNSSATKDRYHSRLHHIGLRGEDSSQSGSASPLSRAGTPASTINSPISIRKTPARSPKWKHLNPSMQHYLQYHHDKITRYHYFLKLDPNDFIHNELIDTALSFEPLLHAVVGFAAYHHTLGKPGGKFQEFWRYYCESIQLLRQWLESHTDRNEAVLLTILQLATFEEYLGDWASLASHQRAAHSIFSTLYTPKTIMVTETSRCIFDWLARGDVAVSLMAGASTVLSRQWFVTALAWHQTQARADPSEVTSILPCLVAKLRLIGFDMATAFAHAGSSPNTRKEVDQISKRMNELRLEIQALHDSTYSARSVSRSTRGEATSEEAFDPHIPLFRGNLWPLNFLWVDWYATEQMHKYQSILFMRSIEARPETRQRSDRAIPNSPSARPQDLPPALEKLSLIQCQIFEAIERSPHAPPGAILGCQASLALSSVFLKKVPKYIMWARRKLANIERLGYVWPPSFRTRMSQLWHDETVLDWWLPNDEYKIDLLDEIREVVEERNKEIEGRGGDERDDVREIKAVFDRLDFGTGNVRTTKDSVWGASGAVGTKLSSPDESEDSDEDDSDDDDDDDPVLQNRTGNRNSNNGGNNSAASETTKRNQPSLEYSNRMSGIWEGSYHAA